ncbi:unnamed protein product [Urochloa humidicola]
MGNTGSSGGPPLRQVPPPQNDRDPGHPPSAAPELPAPALLERHMPVAVSIRIKEKTLRLELDADGRSLLVAFSFDADAPGRITVYFFVQEDIDLMLKTTKENLLKPLTFSFKAGRDLKFKQLQGTGVDLSLFEESELTNVGKGGVFPIALKVEAEHSINHDEAAQSLVKFAIFVKKDNEEYAGRVIKQTLWLHGSRYILQEIYGAGKTSEKSLDDDPETMCAICLLKPRTTTILPCRHMVSNTIILNIL